MTIDAYAHVGEPRFGSAREVVAILRCYGFEKTVLVLGPGIPDIAALVEARRIGGDDVRVMGIPFGETEEQRLELAEVQLRAGISGMRLMPFEVPPNRPLLDLLGNRGLWLYAINPLDDPAVTALLLDWLERWPRGRIAAPHFLRPGTPLQAAASPAHAEQLLSHPRFHAIFSRQGGVGSSERYPHSDLRPWIEDVAERLGWERIMWGSEFPVMYWRNEEIPLCVDWMRRLGMALTEKDWAAFLGGNARRLLFSGPAPEAREVVVPAWVEQQFSRTHTVPLFPPTPQHMPMPRYAGLLSRFLECKMSGEEISFAAFVAQQPAHGD